MKEFLSALSEHEGIPIVSVAPNELGKNRHAHTWVHPQVSEILSVNGIIV